MHPRNLAPAQTLPWRSWYSLQSWRRRAHHQLHEHPLCALCMEQGRITPATVADHHPPHDGDWNKFVLGELRSLLALGSVGYEDKTDEGRRKADLAGGRDGGPAGAMRGPGESYSTVILRLIETEGACAP
jgi:hypothetical protein